MVGSRKVRLKLQEDRICFKTSSTHPAEGSQNVCGETKRYEDGFQYPTMPYAHWYRYKYTVNRAKLHLYNN